MYPYLRKTFYTTVKQVLLELEGRLSVNVLRRRYQLYNAYYAYWALFAARLFFSFFQIRKQKGKESWFFKVNIAMGTWCQLANADPTFFVIFAICSSFPMTTHRLVYHRPDARIWEQVYDIFVRNVDHFAAGNRHLLVKFRLADVIFHPVVTFTRNVQKIYLRLKGDKVVFNQKMNYYLHITPKMRVRVLFIGWFFEVCTRVAYLGKKLLNYLFL